MPVFYDTPAGDNKSFAVGFTAQKFPQRGCAVGYRYYYRPRVCPWRSRSATA